MYNIVLVIHVIVALSLIGLILIQRGRSGGLVEALGGVESILGTKTSSFFVKVTVVLAVAFFLTSISLAYLSKQRGKSLMMKYNNVSIDQEAGSVTVVPENPDAGSVPDMAAEEASDKESASEAEVPAN